MLKLYIVGHTPKSVKIISDLERFLTQEYRNHYTFDVIDLLQKPQLAEKDNVFATPMLIKASPEPARRVCGDLSDTQKVCLILGLEPINWRTKH